MGRFRGERRSALKCGLSGALMLAAFAAPQDALALEPVSVNLVGQLANGHSGPQTETIHSRISNDGRFVVFESDATDLVSNPGGGRSQIYVRDRASGATTLVSRSSLGAPGNADSLSPVITPDGRFVAFASSASNLVTSDSNGGRDVFVHDRQASTTECVSVTPAGVPPALGSSNTPAISADGRFVAFYSNASTLVPGTQFQAFQVYVRDRQLGSTERVSLDTAGAERALDSSRPVISADGRYVAFESRANLTDVPGCLYGIYLRDRSLQTTTLVSMTLQGRCSYGFTQNPAISPDGRFVAWEGYGNDFVADDTNGVSTYDVFVLDRSTHTTTLASRNSSGVVGNANSFQPSISADGRLIAFQSIATNLTPGDTNGSSDVFLRDLLTGVTTLVSRGLSGSSANGESLFAAVSRNGCHVLLKSFASNLVSNDTNGFSDMFLDNDQDNDADGMGDRCDCAPNDPTTYRGAPEVNDGLDNQCPGDLGYGIVDETSGDSGFHNRFDKTEYSWVPQVGATLYEIARSTRSDFASGCLIVQRAAPVWNDAATPALGTALFYLNRPLSPRAGSWGVRSNGVARLVCP